MRPALPTTTAGERWALLDLSLGGLVFRYTDRPGGGTVTDANGRAWAYEGGAAIRVPARTSGQTRGIAIEVPAGDILTVTGPAVREKIVRRFTELGFTYITLDLEGYRTGSMNETLDAATLNAHRADPDEPPKET